MQAITPKFEEFTTVAPFSPIRKVNDGGIILIERNITVGVNKMEEIKSCHLRVLSIFPGSSTVIMWVANREVMIQTMIPAAEITSGKRYVASLRRSTDVPDTTYSFN